MTEKALIIQAENFLNNLNVKFVRPAQIGRVENEKVEIIFTKYEALDPNIVVDPPDIRVWVHKKTGKVELIEQM